MKVIEAMIEKLSKRHNEHIAVYGDDNDLRLTGRHETGHIGKFSYGVADRGGSIRIPRSVALAGCGYFEDRRPASNIDPYRVTGIFVETTLRASEHDVQADPRSLSGQIHVLRCRASSILCLRTLSEFQSLGCFISSSPAPAFRASSCSEMSLLQQLKANDPARSSLLAIPPELSDQVRLSDDGITDTSRFSHCSSPSTYCNARGPASRCASAFSLARLAKRYGRQRSSSATRSV